MNSLLEQVGVGWTTDPIFELCGSCEFSTLVVLEQEDKRRETLKHAISHVALFIEKVWRKFEANPRGGEVQLFDCKRASPF